MPQVLDSYDDSDEIPRIYGRHPEGEELIQGV